MHRIGRAIHSPLARQIIIDGRHYQNFAGCSYLDFAGHSEVIRAAAVGAKAFGLANDLGYSTVGQPIHDIEEFGASFLGFEASLYCTSAYVGCLIVASHFAGRAARAFIDSSSHYSIRHGLLLAGIEAVEFDHCNPADLVARMQAHARPSDHCLVLTDGVFPTWGDIAPLDAYAAVLADRNVTFVVDDAHGTGVLGTAGAGVLEHLSIARRDNCVLITSLSKALGCQGSLIGMSLADSEKVKSSNVIYNSVSLPSMPTTVAALCALRLAQNPQLRDNIRQAKNRLRAGLAFYGIHAHDNVVPIVTFSVGTAKANQRLFDDLWRQGFLVILSRYIGAPEEGAIRITLMSSHSEADIDSLIEAIANSQNEAAKSASQLLAKQDRD